MKNLIITIVCTYIGFSIGSFTGLDLYSGVGALCGLCLPSVYYIGKIYEKINEINDKVK